MRAADWTDVTNYAVARDGVVRAFVLQSDWLTIEIQRWGDVWHVHCPAVGLVGYAPFGRPACTPDKAKRTALGLVLRRMRGAVLRLETATGAHWVARRAR